MRITRIAGVVLAALALAGCGQASSTHSSSHSLSPVKNLVLTAAATHTRHAGSARVAMDMTMSTEQGTITHARHRPVQPPQPGRGRRCTCR